MHSACKRRAVPGGPRRSARIGRAAALAATVVLAGACGQAVPADQLWPNTAFQPAEPWEPTVAATPPRWWEDQLSVSAGEVDGVRTTVLGNRATGQAVTVHYRDGSGAFQSIRIPPGGSVGVASPPARVLAIE